MRTYTGKTCKLHTERSQLAGGFKLWTFLRLSVSGNHCAAISLLVSISLSLFSQRLINLESTVDSKSDNQYVLEVHTFIFNSLCLTNPLQTLFRNYSTFYT